MPNESDRNFSGRRHFYGRRQGHRLNPRQAGLLKNALPLYGLTPAQARTPQDLFPNNPRKLILEIGFGGGEYLAARAQAEPDMGFIGCEFFINGVVKLLRQIESRQLNNIRIFNGDGRDIMDELPDECIDEIYVLYPDPWPKTRHHKRRFISPANLAQFFRLLKPAGALYLASDSTDYIGWMLSQIRENGGFAWQAREKGDWHTPPPLWQPTRYEVKTRKNGANPAYLHFTRRSQAIKGQL